MERELERRNWELLLFQVEQLTAFYCQDHAMIKEMRDEMTRWKAIGFGASKTLHWVMPNAAAFAALISSLVTLIKVT